MMFPALERAKECMFMSQQHMQFDPDSAAESDAYSGGYREETPLSKNYAPNMYRQKLAAPSVSLDISAAQRLALAIVSLSLFVFIILILAVLAFTPVASNAVLFVFTGITVLILYTIVATAINVVFNRRF
jgi:hypothetical protein